MRKIYKILENLLSNKKISRLARILSFALPISDVKKNILLNKKESAENKTKLSSYPYKGVLNLTDVCNLRCKFCEIHYVLQKYPCQYKNFIDLSTLKKYYSLISKMKVLSFYGATGEPLLNPYFPKIIQFLKAKNPEIYLSINTNGILLNEKIAKAMVDFGFDDVLISVHASSKKTYEYLVGGNYEILIRNIQRLVNIRNQKKRKKPQIGLTFALNKINAKDAVFYPEFGKNLGVDYININHYYHVRNKLPASISFYFFSEEGNEILKKVYEKAKRIGIEIRPPFPPYLSSEFSKNSDLLREYDKQNLNTRKCFEPFATLKFKGCVEKESSQYITCCNRILFLRLNYKEYEFNNPKDEIWNHPVFLYMRSTVNRFPFNPICRFCRNKMTPIIRCLDNQMYRELRDDAVRRFFEEVKTYYKIPEIKGIEMLEENPYQ